MGHGAAHHAHIGIDRYHVQPAAAKDVEIRLIDLWIVAIQVLLRDVGAVGVLHGELAQSNRPGARTRFIAKLGLYLVEHHRQLAVGVDVIANEARDDLFMGHGEHQVVIGAIFQPHQVVADVVPTTRLLPDFRRLHDRHGEFLSADSIHLLAQDLFDLCCHARAEREQAVNSGCELTDVAAAYQQLVVGHFCFRRVVA